MKVYVLFMEDYIEGVFLSLESAKHGAPSLLKWQKVGNKWSTIAGAWTIKGYDVRSELPEPIPPVDKPSASKMFP